MYGGCLVRVFVATWCLLAAGAAMKLETSSELEFSGDEGDVMKDAMLRTWCRRSYRRKCSDDVMSVLGEDYAANRVFLDTLPFPYEVIYPTQYRRNELQETLSTRDYTSKHKHAHFHHTIFQVNAFGHKLRLKLELNRELLSKGLRQKRHVDETTQMITEGPVEHCYYHGNVKKTEQSLIALSTCYGLSGVISFGNETFIIKPLHLVHNENVTRHPHVIYQPLPSQEKVCANERGMWQSLQQLHHPEYLRKLKLMKTQQEDHDVAGDMKFLELGLVLDNTMYVRLNESYGATVNYAIQLANIMDAYYRELRIQLHLVFIEVWNMRAQFDVSPNVRQTLHTFMRYWEDSVKPVQADSTVEHDIIHFITAQSFQDNEVGMAIPESVCSVRAVSVSQDPDPYDPQQGAAVAAHMIGHTLGMQHDTSGCACKSPNKCIMGRNILSPMSVVPQVFSECSDQYLNDSMMASLGACLFDIPYEIPYEQTCGNRKLERGEECDCGPDEECELWDPCCDNKACLMKPWATCRRGGCCHNCTVMLTGQVCREPLTNCDVPEICDGISGQCPRNELVQDGQPCTDNNFCYQGLCRSHDNQCYALWGEGAGPGDQKCYEKFNPAGNFNGHCGQDSVTGEFKPCKIEDQRCGLLHCAGGQEEPRVHLEKTFSRTTVVSEDHQFECKIVNSGSSYLPDLGLVEDGSRCGINHLCFNRSCVAVETIVPFPCPLGDNNLTCSGRGVCTTTSRCFCHVGYGGDTCAEKTNVTIIVTTPPATTAAPLVRLPVVTKPPPSVTPIYVPPTTPLAATVVKKSGVSTLQLVVVLACVAGIACVCLGFFMLCYRRRSPQRLQKAHKRKNWFSKVLPPVLNRSKSSDHQSSGEDIPRIIKFGNMPSYRADKMKALRRSMGQISEGGSEHSQTSHTSGRSGNRESTEVKVVQALLTAKAPERGILKKKQRSVENLRTSARCRPPTPTSRTLSNWSLGPKDRQRASALGLNPEGEVMPGMVIRVNPIDASSSPSGRPAAKQAALADLDAEDSDSSIEKKEFSPSDDDYDSDDNWKAHEAEEELRYQKELEKKERAAHSDDSKGSQRSGGSAKSPGSPPPSRLSHSSSASSQGSIDGAANRAKRLKNLTEILDQIDKQAQALVNQGSATPDLPPNHSPKSSNSDERHSSETEVDRHYPRGSFYRQDDDNSPTSPPSKARKTSTSPIDPRLPRTYIDPRAQRNSQSPVDGRSLRQSQSPVDPRGFRKSQSPVDPRGPRCSPPHYISPQVPPAPHQPYSPLQIQIPEVGPVRGTRPKEYVHTRPTPPRTINPCTEQPLGASGLPLREEGFTPPPCYQDISPPRQPLEGSPGSPLGTVPYRGARPAGSAPVGASAAGPPQPPPRPPHLNHVTNPLLDGYPFKRHSLTMDGANIPMDGASISEGYHSDRADPEEPLVNRPHLEDDDLLLPHRRDSYHMARELNERVDF